MRALSVMVSMVAATTIAAASVYAETVHPRIINGSSVQTGDAPWMASLHDAGVEPLYPFGGHFCGAVLIHPQYLLTAAHCVFSRRDVPTTVSATLGRTLLSDTVAGVTVGVETISIHPNYDDRTLDFDVAVLKLENPVAIEPRTVVSPRESGVQSGSTGAILGWGVKDAGLAIAAPTDALQQATVPIPAEGTCLGAMGAAFHPASMLCAGQLATAPGSTDGIDGCYGDSGGPLIATIPGAGSRIVGLSSWGYDNCASHQYYGVYARVDSSSDWIYSAVPFPPKSLSAPVVAGALEVGESVSCSSGEWDGSLLSFSYRFELSNGEVIASGDSPNLVLSKGLLNKRIRCVVTGSGTGGSLEASSEFVGPIKAGPLESRDRTSPLITRIKHSCKKDSCTVTVTGRDPGEISSGVDSVQGKGRWNGLLCSDTAPSVCKPGKRKLLWAATRRGPRKILLKFAAPRTGLFSLRIRLLDAAGNRSTLSRYQWRR